LCLNLHSDFATPKSVYTDLGKRLNMRFQQPARLDVVRRDLSEAQRKLHAYLESTQCLVGPLDLPLRDVFWRLANLHGKGTPLLRNVGPITSSREKFNDSLTLLTALSRHIQ